MIGQTVSHYRILESLGGGGMGLVYRAHDTRLDRSVALKFLPKEWGREREFRERFAREARATSALDHPHICTIYEIDETPDGQLFIAMAYCPGDTLKQRILRGPMAVDEAVTYAIQIADALGRAHEHGIVHRDIKPANILISDHDQVKVVDFGLAKLAGEAAVTREGTVVGTPAYMSPEQTRGEAVDGRSDIWALGAVLYEMVTGRRAFAADHEQAVLLAIASSDPTPVKTLRPDAPAELLRIIRRCLKRNPASRYQNAGELLADLRRFRGHASPAEIVTQTLPSLASVRRRRLVTHRLLPIAAAVAAVLLAAVFYPIVNQRPPRHLLVLPFTCVGADPQTEHLCIGLLETISAKLTDLRRFRSSLSVVPASEVRAQRIDSADEARRIFGVDLVLAGSVQHGGNTLRIPLALVDTASLRQLSSRTLTTELTADFVLQDRIVATIQEMLDIQLSSEEAQALRAGGTGNAEAAQLFLEARGRSSASESETELSAAMTLFRQALDLDPDYLDALVELAQSCHRRSRFSDDAIWFDHGVAYAERALEIKADLPGAHFAAGRCELGRKAYSMAIQHLQRAITLDPLLVLAYTNLAVAYEASGAPGKAEEILIRAERTGPDDWQTYQEIGRFYFERDEWERAAGYFRRVVEMLPENSIGYTSLGGSLFYLGRREEARSNLERAVEIGSGYEGYSNLATFEFFEGRCIQAAKLFERTLEMDDSDYMVWNNLGEAFLCADDPERARAAFTRAAQLVEPLLAADPIDIKLLIDLASFRVNTGDEAGSREAVARAVILEISDPNAMFALAAVYEVLGDRGNALAWIERALRAHYPLGVIEDYPGFAALMEDPRFRKMAAEFSKPAAGSAADDSAQKKVS